MFEVQQKVAGEWINTWSESKSVEVRGSIHYDKDQPIYLEKLWQFETEEEAAIELAEHLDLIGMEVKDHFRIKEVDDTLFDDVYALVGGECVCGRDFLRCNTQEDGCCFDQEQPCIKETMTALLYRLTREEV